MATCVHCGRIVADLETRVWGSDRVCAACYETAVVAAANQSVPAGPPPTLGYAHPASYPPQGNSGLGIASLVLGIACLTVTWVPFCGIIGWPLCLAGLVLAIVDLCQKNRAHSLAIAGLILSIVGFVAPFVCLLGTAMIGRRFPAPANLAPSSSTTQSSPAAPAQTPAPGPVEVPDVEK
ncbi:MAG: hypothetical protein ACHRHE_18025 [Tepidisphaerales bacterium]